MTPFPQQQLHDVGQDLGEGRRSVQLATPLLNSNVWVHQVLYWSLPNRLDRCWELAGPPAAGWP